VADSRRGARALVDWSTLSPGQSLWDGRSPKSTCRLVDGLVGRIVAGRYRLGRLVDDAALCGTYEAYEIETGQRVAIELVARPRDAGLPATAQLRREARRVIAVKHPALRRIRAIGEEGGAPFIVADPVLGESLRQRLTRTGPVPVEESIAIALSMIDAMLVAHAAGIVHANLKPEKVRLRAGGSDAPAATVMGLGVATLVGTFRGVDTRGVGTPPYLAPEQLSGFAVPDELADVWGIGVVLFEAITGQRAFDGDSAEQVGRRIAVEGAAKLRRVCPGVPAALEAIVSAALARKREQRLSLADLRRALRGLGEERVRHSPPPPGPGVIVDCTDPCDDVEGTTDLHVFIDTDLGKL
jgi:serine/threonine-protein kinase